MMLTNVTLFLQHVQVIPGGDVLRIRMSKQGGGQMLRDEAIDSVSQDGSRLVALYGGIYESRLFAYRFATRTTTELFPSTLNSGWPELTSDGTWIVCQKAESPSTGGGALYRISAWDGTPERLPTGSGDYGHDVTPSSSPDGRRIVYASNRGTYPAYQLNVFDVASGDITSLGVDGYSPIS